MLLLGKFAVYIPMAALAAVLVSVAWNMAGIPAIKALLKGQKSDICVLAVTFIITVFIDLTVAIEIGLGFAAFFFIKKMIDVSEVQEKRENIITGIDASGNTTEYTIPENVLVYDIEGPLFFGTVRKFEMAVERAAISCKALVLNMESTIYLDAGGIRALEQCKAACDRKGIKIILSGIHTQPYILFEKTEMVNKIGRENIFGEIQEAIDYASKL
jgi:SulP family sulfate permease